MTIKLIFIAFTVAMLTAGCRSSENASSPNTSTGGAATPTASASTTAANPPAVASPGAVLSSVDPCALLTSDEIKQVQGEAVKEPLRSDRDSGGYIVSQCYYSLPTPSNSVVINLTTAKAGGQSPKELWETPFKNAERKGEKKQAEEPGRRQGEEEEEMAAPEKVSGVGVDAYWQASRIGGALYALKKDVMFRISIGGAGDAKTKLNKTKILARKALARM